MKSIQCWGFEKSLKKFEGMFSIIYFSIKENKLYASRDFWYEAFILLCAI